MAKPIQYYKVKKKKETLIKALFSWLPKKKKIAEEGTLPNSFYKASITLIPKTRQRQHKKRKLQANVTDEHRCKNPQQNFSKQNSATHQKAHTP